MPTKWKSTEKAGIIIDKLVLCKNDKPDSNVSFEATQFGHCCSALTQLVKFSSEIPQHIRSEMVYSSLFSAAKKKRLNMGAISEELKHREANYLKRSLKDYILLTSCSIKFSGKINSIKIKKGTIQFLKLKPKAFDTNNADKSIRRIIPGDLPNNYSYIKVHIKARCEHAAALKALDALDYIRGLWNLLYNRSKGRRKSFNRTEPVNNIVLGPYHTLHNKKGKSVTKTFWWEPSYVYPKKLFSLDRDYNKLKFNEKKLRKHISQSNYSQRIETAVIRYVRALDETNMSAAFLKLWSVLEYITFTEKENYETTIKRTLFIFMKNRDYHKIVLNNLREERNTMVHTGSDSHRSEDMVYDLLFYVDELLIFLIKQKNKFVDEAEVANFLDFSSSKDELESKEKILLRELEKTRYAKLLFK